jgi:hypothetical protein
VPDVETLFYFGGAERVQVDGNEVSLPVGDGLQQVGEKTLAFFAFALERTDFDVVFRTNCSSYVDLANLRAFAATHARPEEYYAGFNGTHEGDVFASGSGYFLSRDLVRTVLAERQRWQHDLLDDVALAGVLRPMGFAPVPVPRRDYASATQVTVADTSFFHFRCKTPSRFRHGDVRIMLALHRAFLRSRGERPTRSLRAHELTAGLVERLIHLAAALRSLVLRTRRGL